MSYPLDCLTFPSILPNSLSLCLVAPFPTVQFLNREAMIDTTCSSCSSIVTPALLIERRWLVQLTPTPLKTLEGHLLERRGGGGGGDSSLITNIKSSYFIFFVGLHFLFGRGSSLPPNRNRPMKLYCKEEPNRQVTL